VCVVALRVFVVAFGLVKFFTRYGILPRSVGDNGPFAMADNDDRESSLTRSTRALQRTAEQAGPAAGASYGLIGAIIVLGGIG